VSNMSYVFHISLILLFIFIFSPNLDQLVREWPFLRSFNAIETSALHFLKNNFLVYHFVLFILESR